MNFLNKKRKIKDKKGASSIEIIVVSAVALLLVSFLITNMTKRASVTAERTNTFLINNTQDVLPTIK